MMIVRSKEKRKNTMVLMIDDNCVDDERKDKKERKERKDKNITVLMTKREKI